MALRGDWPRVTCGATGFINVARWCEQLGLVYSVEMDDGSDARS
jgi:hypothetical protein